MVRQVFSNFVMPVEAAEIELNWSAFAVSRNIVSRLQALAAGGFFYFFYAPPTSAVGLSLFDQPWQRLPASIPPAAS